MKILHTSLAIVTGSLVLTASLHCATEGEHTPAENPRGPMKGATEIIKKQDPPITTPALADQITPDNSRIIVSLKRQRAFLMLGDQIYIDTPVSTGKPGGVTPTGTFSIQTRDTERRSTMHGDFVDKSGAVIRSGVSMRLDPAPGGTHFVSTPMRYFCRLNADGIGIHAGALPGYPASHGCIRLPEDIARVFFLKVKVGTPVEIRED